MILVKFEEGYNETKTNEEIWEYDYNQTLKIEGLNLPEVCQIHFGKEEFAGSAIPIPAITDENGCTRCKIPDSMFLKEEPGGKYFQFFAFAYINDGDAGETVKKILFRVTRRPAPNGIDIPAEKAYFDEVIQEVKGWAVNAVDAKNTAVDAASAAGQLETSAQKAKEDAISAATAAGKSEAETQQAKTDAINAAQSAEKYENNAKRFSEEMEKTLKGLGLYRDEDGYLCEEEEVVGRILTDETYGQKADETNALLRQMTSSLEEADAKRVQSLTVTDIAADNIIETVGAPEYVSESDISRFSMFGITEPGWYVFARVNAEKGVWVSNGFSVDGAAGVIEPQIGDTYIDIAVMFGVAAESQKVIIDWGMYVDTFVFKATDLAVRNLDYRVTFYIYDISEYTEWTYALTTDTQFVADKKYFTMENGAYVEAEVIAGADVPENTYYVHSAVAFRNFVKNISYSLDQIDCPITIYLPKVEDEQYGTWFEIQTKLTSAFSITLVPADGAKVSGSGVHTPKAGINILNMIYHKPSKTWLPTVTHWDDSK